MEQPCSRRKRWDASINRRACPSLRRSCGVWSPATPPVVISARPMRRRSLTSSTRQSSSPLRSRCSFHRFSVFAVIFKTSFFIYHHFRSTSRNKPTFPLVRWQSKSTPVIGLVRLSSRKYVGFRRPNPVGPQGFINITQKKLAREQTWEFMRNWASVRLSTPRTTTRGSAGRSCGPARWKPWSRHPASTSICSRCRPGSARPSPK